VRTSLSWIVNHVSMLAKQLTKIWLARYVRDRLPQALNISQNDRGKGIDETAWVTANLQIRVVAPNRDLEPFSTEAVGLGFLLSWSIRICVLT
jgi:hypothetical protein